MITNTGPVGDASTRAPRVVVVGAGTAGLPAALTALELGAAVTLIDKTDRLGGMLWASGAILSGAGSTLQRERGIADSAERHRREVWEAGQHRADPELLTLAVDHAGRTIDWLASIGTRFTPESPCAFGLADEHEAYAVPRCYVLDAPAELDWRRGPHLAEVFTAALEPWRNSRQLDLRLGARVTALLTDDEGSVTGVRLGDGNGNGNADGNADGNGAGLDGDRGEDGAGGEVAGKDRGGGEVAADWVILATGGYAASPELLETLHGRFDKIVSQGLPHATGDGLRLAVAAGGRVVNADIVIPMMGAIEDPERVGFRLPDGMITLGRPPASAGDIWVNRSGRRFVAEDTASPTVRERAILAQPGGVMVAVFDESMRSGLTDDVAEWTRRVLGEPPDPRLVCSAPTVEDLALAVGMDPATLVETVASYNAAVRTGTDPLARTSRPAELAAPPFHAVRTVSSVVVTFAGVKVDSRLRVLDRAGAPIGGLLAVGEVLGGGQLQGDGFSSGMSVTPAVTFGRIAGRMAAQRAPAGSGASR